MIYSYLYGRLGNILFEVAAGASWAKRMGVSYKAIVDNVMEKEAVKPFEKTILRKIDIQTEFPDNIEIFNQPDFAYSPLPIKKDLILKGYFQSEKYFDKETVRSLFEIDKETEYYIRNKYGDILVKNPVCINVRRGDYLPLEYKHPVCRMTFFNKAISYFSKDVLFLIISDDIEWCKVHFKGEQFYFVDDEPPLVDLYLQTMCSHNIISNSTFSWWGAWLNPNPAKKVIYPVPWFGPFYKKKLDTKDLCPKDWMAISISGKTALYYHVVCSYLRRKMAGIVCKFHL